MYKLIMFRIVLAMWLSLATTFPLDVEVTSQDDSRATPNAGIEVPQQKPVSELAISGYACNPADYYPGQSGNSLPSPSEQPKFQAFAPYWADYP